MTDSRALSRISHTRLTSFHFMTGLLGYQVYLDLSKACDKTLMLFLWEKMEKRGMYYNTNR